MTPDSQSAGLLVPALAARFAETVDGVLPAGPLALVDFPDHSNVGDSAIWLGEMAYLRARQRLPVYHSALGNHDDDEMRAVLGEGTILIHGGGNFGTLWPKHEAFRLHLLRAHRGRPIVQMPESIHYADDAGIAEMATAIREHGNFTLLVRDARSLAFAEKHFDCRIALCPDAALMLGRQEKAAPRARVFALLRTDHERAPGSNAALPEGVIADDWLDEDEGERKRIRMSLRLRRVFTRNPQAMRLARQQKLAEWRLARGLAMLSQGEVVVTDRLHAHILSVLLDIPHVLLDNSYGKVRGFADQWTGPYAGLSYATTREEAIAMALGQTRTAEASHALR